MSLSKHTPTPWRLGHRNSDIGCENVKLGGYAKLFDVRGWGYLTGHGHGGLGLSADDAAKIQMDYAAYVVKAVNSHDALVKSLKEMKRVLFPIFMSLAERDLIEDPVPDDAVLFSFMGSGASDYVTVGEYRKALEATNAALFHAKGDDAPAADGARR